MKNIILASLIVLTSMQSEASTIRLKNFREILSSLTYATNIELKDPVLLKIYKERELTLPQTGKWQEFNSLGASTYFGLTGHFCQKMIDKDIKKIPSQRWAHGDIDFSLPAHQSLNPMVQTAIISLYGEQFWMRRPEQEEFDYLSDVLSYSLAAFGHFPDSTREVLIVVCSVMGSSLSSLIVETK